MKTLRRYAVAPLVAVLATVLATSSVTTLAAAADQNDAGSATISTYADWGDPAMAQTAVDSGRTLVDHLETAQALLATGRIKQARSALVTSREFADTIEHSMPYLTVVHDIRDAGKKVVQEDMTAFSDGLRPVYASLDELQLYAPEVAEHTRGMVQSAERTASTGDKRGASQLLTEAAEDISRHTVYLPVDYVNEQVHGALYALNKTKPDLEAAKAAVKRALNSVTLVIEDVGTPG
jgi:hypothetical protein